MYIIATIIIHTYHTSQSGILLGQDILQASSQLFMKEMLCIIIIIIK